MAITHRSVKVVLALCAIVLAGILVLSRACGSETSPGEKLAKVVEGVDSGGHRVLREAGKTIPITQTATAPSPTTQEGQAETFPVRILDFKLNVPRTVKALNVVESSETMGRPFWSVRFATPRHVPEITMDSGQSSILRLFIAEHDLKPLSQAMVKYAGVSRKSAMKMLGRARARLLSKNDEAVLRAILAASKEELQEADDWDEGAEVLVALLARDWVWEMGGPCHAFRCGKDTVYVIYSRQSHRGWSLFWLAAFGDDGAMRWSGSIGSDPPCREGKEVVEFVRRMAVTKEPAWSPDLQDSLPDETEPPLVVPQDQGMGEAGSPRDCNTAQ